MNQQNNFYFTSTWQLVGQEALLHFGCIQEKYYYKELNFQHWKGSWQIFYANALRKPTSTCWRMLKSQGQNQSPWYETSNNARLAPVALISWPISQWYPVCALVRHSYTNCKPFLRRKIHLRSPHKSKSQKAHQMWLWKYFYLCFYD